MTDSSNLAKDAMDPAWAGFDRAAEAAAGKRIVDLFQSEPGRLARMTVGAAGLTLDLSKQSWTDEGLTACLALAKAAGVEAARGALYAGAPINTSEDRAVLHPALRAPDGASFSAAGEPVSATVEAGRAKMRKLA